MKMNKFLLPFLLIACLFVTACSDDDEQSLILNGDYLEATTWDATIDAKSEDGSVYSNHFIMEFLSKDQGVCKDTYNENGHEGNFKYSITKEMITFSGSIVGNWTVIEHKKDKIVMRAFLPHEEIMTLTKLAN